MAADKRGQDEVFARNVINVVKPCKIYKNQE
jgi:hypothetical protein